MLVGGEEMLHGLRDGEFDIHEAAVAQHHHEEGEPPPRGTDTDRAEFAPLRREPEYAEYFPKPIVWRTIDPILIGIV
jgi:hypothetical protein